MARPSISTTPAASDSIWASIAIRPRSTSCCTAGLLFEQDRGPDLYLSMTIGATRFDAEGGRYDSKSRFSGSLGGGLRMPFGEHVAATAGVRGYLTLVDSNTGILCVSGGGEGGCLLKSSGSTFFQAEAQLGLTFVF